MITATETGQIYCVDAATGDQLWEVSFEEGVYVKPIVREDSAYVATENGEVICCGLSTGTYMELTTVS